MLSEILDIYPLIFADTISCGILCTGVEIPASEEFLCITAAQMDKFLVEVRLVLPKLFDIYLVECFRRPVDTVLIAFDVFRVCIGSRSR